VDAVVLYFVTVAAIVALWHWQVRRISPAAAAAVALLPLSVTGRALLTGRVYGPIDLPFMSEPMHSIGPKYGITGVHNGLISDVYAQLIPWHHALREAWRAGVWPHWNPNILCGDILASALQPAAYDPFKLLSLLISEPGALTYGAAVTFFLAAFGLFVFARELGLREQAALIGAAAWMLSGMMAFFVEWPLARAWALLPFVLCAVRLVVRTPSTKSAVVLTTAFTLLIVTGHPETMLHVVAIAAVYGLFDLASSEKKRAAIGYAVASGIVSLLVTAFAMLPFLEAAPLTQEYTVRNGIYKHTTWPPMPEMVRKRVENSFLPLQAPKPEFDLTNWRTGAVAIALAIAGLLWSGRRRETRFFFALAVICAWSGANALPVARILHALPLFDVALNERLAFAASFSIALLAAIAADAWPSTGRARAAGAAVMIAFGATLLLFDHGPLMATEVVPLVVVAIAVALRMPSRIALPVVCALVLAQRVAVDGNMYPTLPRMAFYPEVPMLRAIPRNTAEPFRIAGAGFAFIPNTATLYGLEDARGYEAMTFNRLYETYPLWSTPQIASFNIVGAPARPFLSFLNVRYLILDHAVTANADALPRAFVPPKIRFEKSALPSMLAATDFRSTAWIEVPELPNSEFDNARGTVRTTRAPNGLDLDVTMTGSGWVVVSETAWPGWRIDIDGRRVRWRFANHAFLGIYVPAGAHHVRLRYIPDSFVRGRTISLVTLALLAIFFVAGKRIARPHRHHA